ncbi:MAG: FAD-dependent oxidoreductase [Myxococcota bacterium]
MPLVRFPLSRRDFLRAAAATAALPACAHRPPPAPADALPGSPIRAVTGPAAGYLGDDPGGAHPILRDGLVAAEVASPREQVPLVVVGGGVSGLATAWLLRDHAPLVLERADQLGGNAKGEIWGDLAYSVGAAYFAEAPRASLLSRRFYRPLGLDRAWRVADGDDTVLARGEVRDGFWGGVTDPARKAEFERLAAHFRRVLDEAYPDMPPGEWKVLSDSQLAELDRRSFREELVAAAKGPLHPHVEALLQHYCWSAFGGTLDEVSAAAGLNFYCAEFEGICALPGGNSRVAVELLRGLSVPPRTSTAVARVVPRADGVTVVAVGPEGPYAIDARAVVVACPKFVAARVVSGVPDDQLVAMRRLRYRAYLVANVLLDVPGPDDVLGMYLLPDAVPGEVREASAGFTDFVVAAWAKGGDPERSVLTLYRALPYDGGRAELLDDGSFAAVRDAFAAQVAPVLRALGIAEGHVREVRVHRWGHPLPLAEPGLVADGTLALARRPVGGRVFFVNQDDWALPSLETCLVRALEEEGAIRSALG